MIYCNRFQPQITEITHPNQLYDYKYRPASAFPEDTKPPPPLPPLRDDGYLRMSKTASPPKQQEESIYHEIPASEEVDNGQGQGQVSFPGYNDDVVGYEVPRPSGYAMPPPPRPHLNGP